MINLRDIFKKPLVKFPVLMDTIIWDLGLKIFESLIFFFALVFPLQEKKHLKMAIPDSPAFVYF